MEMHERIQLPEWDALPDIGLYMDQVLVYLERLFGDQIPKAVLTKSMVNNYVKAGLVDRPNGKKYERSHVAQIVMVCVIKQALSIEDTHAMVKALCSTDVQQGYQIFLGCFRELEEALAAGNVQMQWENESRDRKILQLGILAALCTIRADWLLLSPHEEQEKNCEKVG